MTTESSLRIVVSGLLAQYPLGGVAWDYAQYLIGLRRLGHDVYYVEDTGLWPYNPIEDGVSENCDFNVAYLASLMDRFELRDRWAYRFPWHAQWYGMADVVREAVISSADMVLNLSGSLAAPEEYRRGATLVYVDSDPVFTQVKLLRGQDDFRALIDAHDVHFSFGERVREAGFDTGHDWRPTRQPVVLTEWSTGAEAHGPYRTVMNWTSFKPLVWNGRTFGQKDEELRRFVELPEQLPVRLELAIASGKTSHPPVDLLRRHGWRVVDPADVCPDLDSYRAFLQGARAEWSVAKHGYVAGHAGWFSCRSACFLAAGRPVVVEDTGLTGILPIGEGLLTFSSFDEAVAAIEECERAYARHSEAAAAIADEYFDAGRVLTSLLDAVNDHA
jgi:hypothetical protein